jgi:MFS transporter, ACS family, tartrate transporter
MQRSTTAISSDDLNVIHCRNLWRVLPLLVLGYVFNSLAKANVGFASLEMNTDLHFSPGVFGLGAGLFFVTYTLFEIPSNLMIRRFGARAWLSRILITWGLASMAMALTSNKASFYGLRLLLGLAEAGWYPGVIFYLSLWFPRAFRARAIMLFAMGVPIASIFGSPLSGAILGMPPFLGLRSWQWLFIIEGFPTVILGLFALKLLRNGPADAQWLNAGQKARIEQVLASEQPASDNQPAGVRALSGYAGRLSLFCAINFANALGLYSALLWLPRLVKDFGHLSYLQTGFIAAIPFVFSAIALAVFAWTSDRLRERKWHIVVLFLLGALGMTAMASSTSPIFKIVYLTIAIVGGFGVQAVLFAMFCEGLRCTNSSSVAMAAGLATITTIGNLGGFVGPYAVGLMLTQSGNFHSALLTISGAFALAGGLVAVTRPQVLGESHPLVTEFPYARLPL